MNRTLTSLVVVLLLTPACLARFEVGDEGLADEASSTDDQEGDEGRGAAGEESGTQGGEDELATEVESEDTGECEEPCTPHVELCVDGTCVCRPGFELCVGQCVDTQSDPSHCGQCELACNPGVCSEGECESACQSNEDVVCEGACVELESSPLHCGQCDEPCGGDELCVEGDCVGYTMSDCNSDEDCEDSASCCELEGSQSVCVDGSQCP